LSYALDTEFAGNPKLSLADRLMLLEPGVALSHVVGIGGRFSIKKAILTGWLRTFI